MSLDPFKSGPKYTDVMKTQALKQALDAYGFDVAFGGARRDEEKSRAKERILSFRAAGHQWDPRNQRPELWSIYNTKINPGETIRAFPLSNWTENDIWEYIHNEKIEIPDLYLAKKRSVVRRNGNLIMIDDERMQLKANEIPKLKMVRFRTLGCHPLTQLLKAKQIRFLKSCKKLETHIYQKRTVD